MTHDKIHRLLARFSRAAVEHHHALENLDEKGANFQARILNGLYGSIAGEGAVAQAGLLAMLDGENGVVAGMAAVHLLRFSPERAVATLRELAKEPNLLGFRAAMALERWERGDWEDP